MQRALDELTAAQHKAAEALYRQSQAGGGGAAPGGGGEPGDDGGAASGGGAPKGDVIDAEVVDDKS